MKIVPTAHFTERTSQPSNQEVLNALQQRPELSDVIQRAHLEGGTASFYIDDSPEALALFARCHHMNVGTRERTGMVRLELRKTFTECFPDFRLDVLPSGHLFARVGQTAQQAFRDAGYSGPIETLPMLRKMWIRIADCPDRQRFFESVAATLREVTSLIEIQFGSLEHKGRAELLSGAEWDSYQG